MRDRHRQPHDRPPRSQTHDRPRSSRPDEGQRSQPTGRSTSGRPPGDGGGSNHRPRHERRYRDRDENAGGFGSQQRGGHTGRPPERSAGGRKQTPHYRSQGNPRIGSQRGADSVQGVSGRAGAHFGDLHGPRPSGDRARGYHAEDQFAGDAGRSARDHRYGSRRGHGTRRRENPRTRSGR